MRSDKLELSYREKEEKEEWLQEKNHLDFKENLDEQELENLFENVEEFWSDLNKKMTHKNQAHEKQINAE